MAATGIIKSISDAELGEVSFRRSDRARNYRIRMHAVRGVEVVIPRRGSQRFAEAFFNENRAVVIKKMKSLRQRQPEPPVELSPEEIALLRARAKAFLPAETRRLAAFYRFTVGKITVRASRSRWGSCSRQKNISLSLFLMTLPEHLQRYVILHELCHTVEMNHSSRFWALLNSITEGKALELRKELRDYGRIAN